ncbi:MAG: helix-hairpin-helix domain-containing protein [Candidatus Margulisiibacteriota bacterium]
MLNELSREQQLIILGLVLVVVAGLGVMAFRPFSPGEPESILLSEPQTQAAVKIERAGQLIVHVAGAVKQEGVYKLKFGDRIIDALNFAGGATNMANLSSINLADKVKDGQKINIPAKQIEVERGSGDPVNRGSGTASSGGKVNINSGSEKDLCKITGIGASTAKKIIEYRSSNGPFSKIEDIMKVKSIGKGKFGKIKGQITI